MDAPRSAGSAASSGASGRRPGPDRGPGRTGPREGVYRIRNEGSGLVLQLEGASRVRVGPDGPPAPEAARRWRLAPTHSGAGVFHVVSEDNGRRLDVANASTDSGARVQVWRANAFGAQEWVVEEHLEAPGVVSLVACVSGLLLEADGEGRARQAEDSDSPSQWWRLEPA
ncbi:RICIN domain-containing protein [Streptomyces sp. NPDC059525]|uniref:RICIN domain-containing protein n=1 Tax=unclassified Streptomyces TaxID=2593676 RepID=UPI00362FEDA5